MTVTASTSAPTSTNTLVPLPMPTVGIPGNDSVVAEYVSSGPADPFDAETLARLEADAQIIISRYPKSRSALLPMLHLVQSEQGYVSPDGIEFCARTLGLTAAEVTAVATFYTQYKRHPVGEYSVGVCTNTLCAIMGGDAIYARVKDHLGIGHDETTADGKVTLEHLECNAACDYAPVMMVNWEFYDNQTPESAVQLVDRLCAGKAPLPTRGASLKSFKEASRVLAGFYDGRADEGVAAGPATLAGLKLVREQGTSGTPAAHGTATGDGSGRILPEGRPSSAHDGPLQTAASDSANSTPAGAAGAGSAADSKGNSE